MAGRRVSQAAQFHTTLPLLESLQQIRIVKVAEASAKYPGPTGPAAELALTECIAPIEARGDEPRNRIGAEFGIVWHRKRSPKDPRHTRSYL